LSGVYRKSFDDTFADGKNGSLSTIICMEFMENIPDMIFDGFLAQIQHIGDFFVGFTIGD
jgi:hypothetical protein